MSSEVQNLEIGQVEIVISKQLAQGAENIQARIVVDKGTDFEKVRKELYSRFIKPRQDEHAAEQVEYQKNMALMQKQLDEGEE
jgi:hypothetical protein